MAEKTGCPSANQTDHLLTAAVPHEADRGESDGQECKRAGFGNIGIVGHGLAYYIAESERLIDRDRRMDAARDPAERRTQIAAGCVLKAGKGDRCRADQRAVVVQGVNRKVLVQRRLGASPDVIAIAGIADGIGPAVVQAITAPVASRVAEPALQ